MQQKRHILVLGASGKLGRLVRRWWELAPPPDLRPLWQYRKNSAAGDVTWLPGDPPPPDLPPIDAILALWGVTPGEGHDLAENSRLAVAAMELGAALAVDRVLHCSSAAVYQPGPRPLREDRAGGQINPYGAAKLEMEAHIADWCAAHPAGPRACTMRIGNVAGADSLFAALSRGGRVTLDRFASGEGSWRSYISVPMLARAFEALLTCGARLPDVVNVAAPDPVAMEAIVRAAGREIDWRPAPDTAAPMVWLDTDRLSRLELLPAESAAELVGSWRLLEEVA